MEKNWINGIIDIYALDDLIKDFISSQSRIVLKKKNKFVTYFSLWEKKKEGSVNKLFIVW